MENDDLVNLVANRLDGKNIIAIASGKGGVGKTWLSITLAHLLAQNDKKILLFDGDLGLANIDIYLGMNAKMDMSHVVAGKVPLNQIIEHDSNIGCDVIAGVSGSMVMAGLDSAQLQVLVDDLAIIAQSYDGVIIDLHSGIAPNVLHLSGVAKSVYIVCTSEPTSLSDAYAFIKCTMQQNKNATIKIIINCAATIAAGQGTYQILRTACESFLSFTPELLGVVRYDSRINDLIEKCQPLLSNPDLPIVADLSAIAQKIDL